MTYCWWASCWLLFFLIPSADSAESEVQLNFFPQSDLQPNWYVNIQISIGKCINQRETPTRCLCYTVNTDAVNPNVYDCCLEAYEIQENATREFAEENKNKYAPEEVQDIERFVLPSFIEMLHGCNSDKTNWQINMKEKLYEASSCKLRSTPLLILLTLATQFVLFY